MVLSYSRKACSEAVTRQDTEALLTMCPAAGAILDRLLYHAEIIPINGAATHSSQPPGKKLHLVLLPRLLNGFCSFFG
jgi:hypothetical protein